MIKMKCDCCGKERKGLYKDYRYIEGVAEGKVFVCKDCYGITDVEYYKRSTGR